MPRIRICICATVPLSIEAFYGKQLNFLYENGFDVTVITSYTEAFAKSLPEHVTYRPVPFTRQMTPWQDFKAFLKVINIFRREKFDLLQYNTPKAALICSFAGWVMGIPTRLYLMWGLYFTGQSGWRRLFYKTTEKLTCQFSTHIAPDGKENCQFAISEGLCNSQVAEVIGEGSANGIDVERFNKHRFKNKLEDIRREIGASETDIVVGIIARLGREKGINELVRAYLEAKNEVQDSILLLVGPTETPCSFDTDVVHAIENEPTIISVGFQREVEKYLAIMDIFTLPSYREGFGVVNLEANAMELPVITTNIVGPRESIVDSETGVLVACGNVKSLKNAIIDLCNNPEKRQQMGKNGRRRAIELFEQKKHWRRIVAHRKKIISERP